MRDRPHPIEKTAQAVAARDCAQRISSDKKWKAILAGVRSHDFLGSPDFDVYVAVGADNIWDDNLHRIILKILIVLNYHIDSLLD